MGRMGLFAGRKLFIFVALTAMVLVCAAGSDLFAGGNWNRVMSTADGDYWYVDQVISYAKRGNILSSRAYLMCAPGKESAVSAKLKKGLKQAGFDEKRLQYFVESVEVDCAKRKVTVSDVVFYDRDDTMISSETFQKPREYEAKSGSVYDLITGDLCRGSDPSILDNLKALKNKKFFLNLFSKREAS